MFRRSTSTILMICYLATQMAMMPHSHEGMSAVERRAHDAAPHFHFAWANHTDHAHGHSHDHSASHAHSHSQQGDHDHNKGIDPAHDQDANPGCDNIGWCNFDHDSDAAYISFGGGIMSARTQSKPIGSGSFVAFPGWVTFAPERLMGGAEWVQFHHPPDPGPSSAQLYLTLRNLRI